jgi:hypothetical protein
MDGVDSDRTELLRPVVELHATKSTKTGLMGLSVLCQDAHMYVSDAPILVFYRLYRLRSETPCGRLLAA